MDIRPATRRICPKPISKIKAVFWHNNITAFAPVLETAVTIEQLGPHPLPDISFAHAGAAHPASFQDSVFDVESAKIPLSDGSEFLTGIERQIRGGTSKGAGLPMTLRNAYWARIWRSVRHDTWKQFALEKKEGTDVLTDANGWLSGCWRPVVPKMMA